MPRVTACLSAAGPGFGASGEVMLSRTFGLAGAVRAVPWPHRSLDWNAALQFAIGDYQLRLGVRHVFVEDGGYVDGRLHSLSFIGPWVGVGLRLLERW